MTADSITSEIEAHARRLVEVLGGKWMRTHGMCRCPAHADRTPSLSISVGRQAVLLHCFAGCATVTVIAALARQGVKMADLFGSEVEPWPSPATEPRKAAPDRNAVRLWKQAHGIAGSAAAAYLAGRSIETCSPELRFHPRTPLGPRGAVRFLPAMLAAVRTDLGVIAIHRTFLTPDGSGKAAVEGARRALGNLGTGAVRLGWPFEGKLGLAEGVETALSAAQLFTMPCWAVLGNERFGTVTVPETVTDLYLCVDADAGGEIAVARARRLYADRPVRLHIQRPEVVGSDWNDVLRAMRLSS
ncbi:toprim domain-containing protein [Novosphingobium sp. KCTC 2891]|uniref:DUF7146 domain-containing protein n=1 Tax=Novosphingobium sp. KCTC 2891 TaxID=2989730 RepID=UPI002221F756|nr:toprim domain-containing protein [Novosphingobium sp. KCTC 2891]MCW1384850.1 toprim domain-containing protein [Novosphingobium sp. KCTC 2891]